MCRKIPDYEEHNRPLTVTVVKKSGINCSANRVITKPWLYYELFWEMGSAV